MFYVFKVKTWFQNRRMKLRREQKSTGTVWGPERYAANKDRQAGGAPLSHSSHGPPAVSHDYVRLYSAATLNVADLSCQRLLPSCDRETEAWT